MKISRLILVAVLLPPIALAKVVHIAEHGFKVENRIQVQQTPAHTWNALIDEVDSWWPKDHTWWGEHSTLSIEPELGGCFCEHGDNKAAAHMQIVFVEPGKLLRMSGGLGPLQGMGIQGALDWQFGANEQGTEITLTYTVVGMNPEGFKQLAPIVDQVQAIQLGGLGDFLHGAQ